MESTGQYFLVNVSALHLCFVFVCIEDKFRAQKHYLEGKSLNVTPVASQQAVKLLERAVKLDPKLTDAWNQLGECYWKSGKPLEAKNCFLGALQHVCMYAYFCMS